MIIIAQVEGSGTLVAGLTFGLALMPLTMVS
jgi:hypothetical protein